MSSRTFNVLAVLALVAGTLGLAAPSQAAPPGPDYRPAPVGEDIREMEANAANLADIPENLDQAEAEAAAASASTSCITDTKFFLVLDNTTGGLSVQPFNLYAQSDLSQIWVQANLSWADPSDPRVTPVVTCEQAEYMQGEFDNRMYPAETEFFGEPNEHDGTNALLPLLLGLPADYYADAQGRQVVLVSNVRDQNYYDSDFPLYIAGFFTTAFEVYFDRNTMTIDAFDWENRTGLNSDNTLYEGVFAHEYQHLLHADYDPDEVTWVNEGLSDFAEFLVGYGHPESHVQATADLPENSLTVWEDQGGLEILSDYGHAYFYMLYLYEQFGGEVLQDLFLEPANSISGVNSALAGYTSRTFADVYHDYSVALLIDSKKAGGHWEFENIDFNLDIGTPNAPNPEAYDTPGAPPWGTDYIWLDSQLDGNDARDVLGFSFNGEDFTVRESGWSSDGEVLHSGTGNLVDNWAIFETTGGNTLTFDTSYDIEEFWDFGFVQVSTDGGETWESLSNDHTTSTHADGAHPKVVENLPGLTGVEPGTTMSFDLPYADQDILVAFRYVTDWALIEPGWTIDNVEVDGELISDGSDMDPFKDLTYYQPVDFNFQVTLVGVKQNGNGNQYKVMELPLDDMTEEGLTNIRKLLKQNTDVVLMVTYEAAEGETLYADYEFELILKEDWPDKGNGPGNGNGNGPGR